MITLKPVTQNEKELLWNINQKYLYEMTKYYPDEMDENGNYHYGYFEAYFTEPARKAYLIYSGQNLAGFAMLNPHSYIGHKVDFVIAEFCVFPAYRRQHIAQKASEFILKKHPGKWKSNSTGTSWAQKNCGKKSRKNTILRFITLMTMKLSWNFQTAESVLIELA